MGDETSRSVASLNNPVVDYPRAPWEPQDDAPSAPASRARAHTTVGESAANDAPAPPVSAEDEAWLWGAE